MVQVDTDDLALLALAGNPDSGDRRELSVVALSDRLEMGAGTMADRVALLTTLSELEDRGLVAGRTADGRTVYALTDRGRERARGLHADVTDRRIEVTNGATEEISLGEVGRYLAEPAVVRALARVTDDGTLYLTETVDEEFVDRREELDALAAHLERTRVGRGRAVLVTGPPGVGKTALVEEALARADGIRRLSGVFRADASEPYRAVREAVEPALEGSPFAGRELVPEDPDDLEDRRSELFAAVADALDGLAADEPVVLFLDDLQHAAAPAVELVRFLARRARNGRVLVVVSATLVAFDDAHPATTLPDEWAEASAHDHLSIGTFDREATRRLVEVVLGTRRVPAAFVDRVDEHTGGNALFVTELVSELLEADAVVPAHDVYPDDLTRLAPPRVEDTIQRRLAALDDDGQQVLEAAALLGEAFALAALVAACHLPEPRVREYVDVLVDANVLMASDGGSDQVRFASRLFHETVTERIPAERRRTLHREIAERLDERAGDDPERAATIAAHYERAGDDRALERWLAAGQHAESVYAHEGALEAYERALSLARETGADERVLEVLESIGDVATLLGEQDRAGRAFEYVRSEAGDLERRSRAVRKLAAVHETTGAFDAALGAVEEGLAGAPADSAERCRLLGVEADVRFSQGDYDRARATTERQLELANDLGVADLETRAVRRLGSVATSLGDYERAREHFERSLESARSVNDRRAEASSRKNLGVIAYFDGDHERARDHYERSLQTARELGARRLVGDCVNNLGLLAKDQGDYERAREHFERALEIDRDLGDRQGESKSLHNLGTVALNRGAYDRAREYYERSLAIKRELGDRQGQARSLENLGLVASSVGDYERAREYSEESLAIKRALGDRHGAAISHKTLGETYRELDEYDRAADSLDRALETAEDLGDTDVIAAVRLARAQLALDEDEPDRAREHVRQAREAYEELDRTRSVGRTRLLLGRAAAADGAPDRARDHWRAALETFESVDAPQGELATLEELVETCREVGDTVEAREWCRHARDVLAGAPAATADQHREWVQRHATDLDA